MTYRVFLTAAISAAVLLGASDAVYAQVKDDAASYPTRPIRFIVPAAPGGTTDGLARIFGQRMNEIFKQQVVVDNRASASGVVAGELTAQAAPDGYTIFLPYHQHTINAALLPKLPYHPVNDFTPITTLTHAALLLVVHPSTPVNNFKDFLEWTRTYKGGLNFGSAGIGSGGHLAGELYNLMAKVKAVHIPYKGTGPATQALLGKEYHYNFMGLLAGSQLHRDGRVRALAITSAKRHAALPDIPTVAESGLPGFDDAEGRATSTLPAARRCPASATAIPTCSRRCTAQLDQLALCAYEFLHHRGCGGARRPPGADAPRRHQPRLLRLRRLGGVEAALKLARQYFVEIGEPQRRQIIARRQSYHGNTLGALATGGNEWRRAAVRAAAHRGPTTSPCFAYRTSATARRRGLRRARSRGSSRRRSSARPRVRHGLRRRDRGRRHAGACRRCRATSGASARSATATACCSSSTR
jgi:tripartite-type tricarboxylate transporter receptor subunit TctC